MRNRDDEYILLGKITKPHGIRGEVKIYPYSGNAEQFVASYTSVYLASDGEAAPVEYTIERSRVQGRQVLVCFKNCTDRNTAEKLTGREVYVLKGDLPELDEKEFYLHQLEGKRIVDKEGTALGVSRRILTGGGQDILIIDNQGREYMVPIVGAFIRHIGGKEVVLDLPPGLLDIND